MNFGFLVLGSPFSSYSCHTALDIVSACLKEGHSVHRVFFYQDAVLIGNKHIESVNSSDRCQESWQSLQREYDLDLTLCISAAQRRGISELKQSDNVAEGFCISGLGQLIEATLVCDRMVTVP